MLMKQFLLMAKHTQLSPELKELQNLHIKILHHDVFRTSSRVTHMMAIAKEERLLGTVPTENIHITKSSP